MFRSFFPVPKVFFLSAAVWMLLTTLIFQTVGDPVRRVISIDRFLGGSGELASETESIEIPPAPEDVDDIVETPRVHENLVQPLRNIDFSRFSAGAGNPRQTREFALNVLRKAIRIDLHPAQNPRNQAVLLAQHGKKKVLRLDARIPRRDGERLRLGERFLRFFCKR